MVQVICASSPSTKGVARTLFTNRGGTAEWRRDRETKTHRQKNPETEMQRNTQRGRDKDRHRIETQRQETEMLEWS